MTSAIETLTQSLSITEVSSVVVTPIVADDATFVREIRIFGTPAEGSVPVLIVRLIGDTADVIKIDTPELTF